MPSILNYELADYQQAARTYRPDLLRLPILALQSELQHMTLRPGVCYEEAVGTLDMDVELAPYKRNYIQDGDVTLKHRILRTNFGSLNKEFDPNATISTLMGHRANIASGDGLSQTPLAHEVIAMTPKRVGYKLLMNLADAEYNPGGTTTKDLFDGFDTITRKEIADGNISEANGNYMMLGDRPDKLNAVDLLKDMMEKLPYELRGQALNIYCPVWVLDAYNRAYKAESNGISYNTKYNQYTLEGSSDLMRFVPMVSKHKSEFIHICPKENVLVGVDQLSDQESIRIGDYSPDTFMVMMRMFFGVQFESIDYRRFCTVEIPA